MTTQAPLTFIVDCPDCKARVAAIYTGKAEHFYSDGDHGPPCGDRVFVGNCPQCGLILVGKSDQVAFKNIDSDEDAWSDVIRVYPKPPKVFSSWRIPNVVSQSLDEAHRAHQAGANIAACMMLGRALEALCCDVLEPKPDDDVSVAVPPERKKPLMLAEGIKRLRDTKVIDDRLYDWSQQLRAFRNVAAHAVDISISRQDAEDLQTFVNAIVEYVYDLTDRYAEFKERVDARAKPKKF